MVSDRNRRVHRTVARQRFRSRPDDRQEPQRYQTAGTWAVRYEHRLHGAPVSLPRTASPSSFCHRQRLRSPNPVWHVLTQRPGSGESLRKRFCIVRCRANGQRREKTQPAHYRKTRRVDHPRSQLRHRSKQGQHQRHANQAQGYRAFKQRLGPAETSDQSLVIGDFEATNSPRNTLGPINGHCEFLDRTRSAQFTDTAGLNRDV